MMPSLYERLGGTGGIAAIASDLADLHLDNPRIAPRYADSDLAALVSTFQLSSGANATVNSVPQVSGTTPNDFTTSVTYTVLAQDGIASQNWLVTVTISDKPEIRDENLPIILKFVSSLIQFCSIPNCSVQSKLLCSIPKLFLIYDTSTSSRYLY